jgi:hypothetical protein
MKQIAEGMKTVSGDGDRNANKMIRPAQQIGLTRKKIVEREDKRSIEASNEQRNPAAYVGVRFGDGHLPWIAWLGL